MPNVAICCPGRTSVRISRGWVAPGDEDGEAVRVLLAESQKTVDQEGAVGSFAEISERYRAPLRAYCVQVVGSDHADDVVQQTMLKAWRALREGKTEVVDLRAWLYGIARNQAMDLLRDPRRAWEELDSGRPSPVSIEAAAEMNDRLNRTAAGIRELPARQRTALVMHALGGDSYAEIAATMHTNQAAVGQLIVRARARLRELPAVSLPGVLLRRVAGAAQKCGWLGSGGKAVVVLVAVGGGAVPWFSPAHQPTQRRERRTPSTLAALSAVPAGATHGRTSRRDPPRPAATGLRFGASRKKSASDRARARRDRSSGSGPRSPLPSNAHAQATAGAQPSSATVPTPGPGTGSRPQTGIATVAVPIRDPVRSVPSLPAVPHEVPALPVHVPDPTPGDVATIAPAAPLP